MRAAPTQSPTDAEPTTTPEPRLAPAPIDTIRRPTDWDGDASLPGRERGTLATKTRLDTVKKLFADAGVAFPPTELYFRVFKQDKELEVWANGKLGTPMSLIATYGVCAMSGGPGRKRAEGDRQVPEGFYRISYFWPDEVFHLAAKINYPNPRDLAENGPHAGGDIMIHGGCGSVGCIAMSDERIEELWAIGEPHKKKGLPIDVHIFPARDISALLADSTLAAHHTFWGDLQTALDSFKRDQRPQRR